MLCGATDSFLPFLMALRRTSQISVEIIVPSLDFDDYEDIKKLPNIEFRLGSPTEKNVLEAAGMNTAK